MGRVFAPIFGSVAFLVVLVRGALHGSGVEPTLEKACLALGIFSILGGWIGWIAASAVEQSVQATLESQLGPAPPATGEATPSSSR